jgi:hypothetical protein
MKAKFRSIIVMAALVALARPWAASGAMVVPAPMMTTRAPSSYVWDGRQYVGVVGNQYFYLGPGNVWIAMDPGRMNHFRGWERAHPNWRTWATPNVRYRTVRPGRPQPMPIRANPPGTRPPPVPIVPPPPPPGTRSGGRGPRSQPMVVAPGTRPQPVAVNSPGTRSGGSRSSRSQRSGFNPSTNPYTIPRLKPSPGGPAYWH